MSIKIMSQVWENSTLSSTPLFLLIAIADFANDDGFAWPSVDTLARKVRLSKRQAQRVIQDLLESGEIKLAKESTNKTANVYRVTPQTGNSRGDNMTPLENARGDISDGLGVTSVSPYTSSKPKKKSSVVDIKSTTGAESPISPPDGGQENLIDLPVTIYSPGDVLKMNRPGGAIYWLSQNGVGTGQARTMVNKWRTEISDEELCGIIRGAGTRNVSKPIEYISKAVGNTVRRSTKGKRGSVL